MSPADQAELANLDELDDRGITLVEIVVAMMIMSVFMAMFTAGVVQMFHITNANEAAASGQSQVNIAFLRLDREIRYAADISTPSAYLPGADFYVEYLTTSTGVSECTGVAVEVATSQLQRRTWIQGTTPLVPSAWSPFANDVSAPVAPDPDANVVFTLTDPDAVYTFQRLRLSVVATSGSGSTASTKRFGITFTALNSSAVPSGGAICTEGRVVP